MPQINRDTIKNRFLGALPPKDLEEIYENLHPVSLSIRQILYDVGSPIEHIYFIELGVASVLTTMANGVAIEVCMIGMEGIVGVAVLLGTEISTQHVVVQVPGAALRINAPLCKAAFDRSPAFRLAAFRFIDALLNLSAQSAACNRLHTVEQRAARWLLMASDRIRSNVMPMTHEFLSSMLGVRRAGVSEAAGELQRSALIRYHHGKLTITDRDGLEAAACECYALDRSRFDGLF